MIKDCFDYLARLDFFFPSAHSDQHAGKPQLIVFNIFFKVQVHMILFNELIHVSAMKMINIPAE